MAFCPHCGTQIEDGAQFCPNCGKATVIVAAAPAATAPTVKSTDILKRAFSVLAKKPIYLWGLSLLATFLTALSKTLGGAVPLIGIAVALVLEFGMAWVYLEGYRGNEVKVDQIFEGFKNFKHVLAAMGWRAIVVLLWFIVPFAACAGVAFAIGKVAFGGILTMLTNSLTSSLMGGYGSSSFGRNFGRGIKGMGALVVIMVILIIAGLIAGLVFYCIKYYAYSLVPYITAEKADLDALNIARESDAKTKGYKGKMFGTDILIVLMIAGVGIVFGIFGKIPAIGGFFAFLGNLVDLCISLVTPLLFGLVRAAWYEEINNANK